MMEDAPARKAASTPTRLGSAAVLLTVVLVIGAGPAAAQQDVAQRDAINPGLGAAPADVVRNSPAGSWRSFLALATAGKFGQAAHLLDLSETSPTLQKVVGPEMAEKLFRVLLALRARPDSVTTEDAAGPAIGGHPTNVVVAMRFERSGISGEVRLRRTSASLPPEMAWLFSRETVASVPFWYRVLVKGEAAQGAEPLDIGLGPIPAGVRRRTPRESVAGFLAACQGGHFGLAAYYLDLGAIPPDRQRAEGARLARRLVLVLQRTGAVKLDALSDASLGKPETGVPENEQLFAAVDVGRQPIDLLLSHRMDAELGHVWVVSQDTVAQIDRLYEAHGYGWLGDHAPVALFALSIGELQLWQWLGILVGLLASWLLSRYLGRFLVRALRRVTRRTAAEWDDLLIQSLDGPTGFVLAAVILLGVARWLGLTPDAWMIARYIAKLLALVGAGWFLVRLVDAGAQHVRETARAGSQVGLGFVPVVSRIAKVVAVVLVALAALDVIGINVVAGLGALGIGAAAIAFAAQKTLENLFGTAAIASDRPYEVGDFVAIGQDLGTVEEVGLRSTRLRTIGRTLVTLPNGLIAAGRVENYTARDRIMYKPVLTLVYDTTVAQLRYVIEEIKNLLRSHPKVSQEGHRVRFAAFGESALRLEMWCWIATRDYVEYTGVVEELNFAIAGIVERAGTSFAFPSRTLYMAKDGVINAEKAREVEREVARRGDGSVAPGPGQPAQPDGTERGTR
jgi:MscS family membrane protein